MPAATPFPMNSAAAVTSEWALDPVAASDGIGRGWSARARL